MLEEAHALKKRGVDVVLAFIETHGRADTAVLIEGLEVIPRQRVEYKGGRLRRWTSMQFWETPSGGNCR